MWQRGCKPSLVLLGFMLKFRVLLVERGNLSASQIIHLHCLVVESMLLSAVSVLLTVLNLSASLYLQSMASFVPVLQIAHYATSSLIT